jgi:hypothetical protein
LPQLFSTAPFSYASSSPRTSNSRSDKISREEAMKAARYLGNGGQGRRTRVR